MNGMDFGQAGLLIVDVQQGLDDPKYGPRNNPQAEQNIAALLARWRERGWTVIHVQHASTEPNSPLRPDQPGFAFKPEASPLPGEMILRKEVNSAFIGTELKHFLYAAGVKKLVIVGLTTDHCVSTTVRMAGNYGFRVWLPADGTATHGRVGWDGRRYSAAEMHEVHLASLHGEFCTVVTTADLLAQT